MYMYWCHNLLQNAAIEETKVLEEKFKQKDGPVYRTLDPALAQLHVERQAYHGGIFVGNHVHKLLKDSTQPDRWIRDTTQITVILESSAEVLCSGIVRVAREMCPELLPLATEVHTRFTEVLRLYAKCHNVFNGGVTSESTIDQLGK